MPEKKFLTLNITRVDGAVFSGEVESITVPGVSGEMTLLPKHQAIISPLKEGVITYRIADSIKQIDISSGMLEFSNNQANILV